MFLILKFLVGIRIMTKNSRAEEMREKSKNAASAWLDFSQRKNKNMDTYHFFFEGYDRFYYFNKFKFFKDSIKLIFIILLNKLVNLEYFLYIVKSLFCNPFNFNITLNNVF